MARARPHDRLEARRLRAEGASVRTIAKQLGVAKSSVSVWVRDVEPPPTAMPTPATRAVVVVEPDRRCSRCQTVQPAANFNRAGGGRQWWCRACFRRYYEEGRAHHTRRSNALRARRKRENYQLLLEYLLEHPCLECGEHDPVLLEFDHVATKQREVTILAARGVRRERLLREIAACEVVCANCHRRRTARRAGWKRLDPAAATFESPRQARNVRAAWARLRERGCVDCGVRDLCVLEFDHVGVKSANVMWMAWAEASLERLGREMDECVVRCANCHRRRTAATGRHFRSLMRARSP